MRNFFGIRALAGLFMATLMVGAANASPINLAPIVGTAGASSETYGAASLAIDNNTNTVWSPGTMFQTGLELNPYWYVDLGGNYALTSLNIFQRTDYAGTVLNDFTVTVFDSLNNVTFTHDYATGASDTVPTPFAINFASVVQGKVVQIILDSASPQYLALAEVQVFGNTLSSSDVPEPASMGLLALGLVGGAATRFAKRKFA